MITDCCLSDSTTLVGYSQFSLTFFVRRLADLPSQSYVDVLSTDKLRLCALVYASLPLMRGPRIIAKVLNVSVCFLSLLRNVTNPLINVTKYWKTLATTSEGRMIAILAETTDDAIGLDRSLPTSLIQMSKEIRFIPPATAATEENDHFYLAEGAIMAHCRGKGIILGNQLVEVTDFLPARSATNRVGEGFLVPIWEELVAP
jgi:hypothetical protein